MVAAPSDQSQGREHKLFWQGMVSAWQQFRAMGDPKPYLHGAVLPHQLARAGPRVLLVWCGISTVAGLRRGLDTKSSCWGSSLPCRMAKPKMRPEFCWQKVRLPHQLAHDGGGTVGPPGVDWGLHEGQLELGMGQWVLQ